MRVGQGHLHWDTALCATDIDKSPVVTPGEFLCDGPCRAHAESSHCTQETLYTLRLGVQLFKEVATALGLILWTSSLKTFSQRTPKTVQPGTCHFQHSTDVGWLFLVQERVSLARIGVPSGGVAVQHLYGNERVQ